MEEIIRTVRLPQLNSLRCPFELNARKERCQPAASIKEYGWLPRQRLKKLSEKAYDQRDGDQRYQETGQHELVDNLPIASCSFSQDWHRCNRGYCRLQNNQKSYIIFRAYNDENCKGS